MEFRSALQDPASFNAFEALGWLVLLMPTHAALRYDGEWGLWMQEWMHIWGSVVHSRYWQALWINLIARLAKHDVHGLVDWPSLMPEIWSRFMWVFSVPVGTASSSIPFSSTAPGIFQAMFATDMGSRSAAVAKAAIYLIGRCRQNSSNASSKKGAEPCTGLPVSNESKKFGNPMLEFDDPNTCKDQGLEFLEFASTLLEQYFHPSNGGKWTPTLATFLKSAVSHLADRLVAEHYAAEGCVTAISDDEVETEGEESESEIDVSMQFIFTHQSYALYISTTYTDLIFNQIEYRMMRSLMILRQMKK